MAARDPSTFPTRHSLADTWAHAPTGSTRTPRVLSMGYLFPPEDASTSHRNKDHQLSLLMDAPTGVIHAGERIDARPGDLFITRPGEVHGYDGSGPGGGLLLEIYCAIDAATERACPLLGLKDPLRRLVRLSQARQREYQRRFIELFMELHLARAGVELVGAALLCALLVTVCRWDAGDDAEPPAVAPDHADAEVLELWRRLHVEAASGGGSLAHITTRVPHYDRVRHRYGRAFGESPRRTWLRLCMRQARRLLLETELPIRAIAERVGYARQHEFARAFHREIGCSPTWWRAHGGDPRHHRESYR